jgi:nitrate reductase gamma subunit
MQGGKEVGYNPHNYYIQTLLRTGAVGLAALLGTYVLVMRRLGRLSLRGLGRHGDMFWVLLAVQLVFDIAYGLPWSQSIILGMAMALSVQYGAGRSTQTATVDEAPRRLAHVP